ncbi:MAG TPA: ribbon-helix-helix domain-containing protein [Blastocatellia bacterium]|nr:ribbon-helix-helix domain-containing protein [Blastocatellia bacterium]
MESLHVELPDKLADELHRLVQEGWFQTEQEVVRLALAEFVRRHQVALTERFQHEDIEWALAQAGKAEMPER